MLKHNATRQEIEVNIHKGNYIRDEGGVGQIRCLDNFYLWVDKDDISLTPCLYKDGFWESWVTSWFTHEIVPGDYVVDIGAHCGYYTMLFERLTNPDNENGKGKVAAYEPNPKNVRLMGMTRKTNGAQFDVCRYALSDAKGEAVLEYPGEYTGSARITGIPFEENWGESVGQTVRTTTLDDEIPGAKPNLVKMDVEGAEEKVWNGGRSLWYSSTPPVVVMEFTPNSYSQDFVDEIFDYGDVNKIDYDGKERPVSKEELSKLKDWIMIVIRKS